LFPVIYLIGKVKKYILKPDYNKILITHFGAMGDILMCTPALKILRNHFPYTKIHFLISDRGAFDIIKRNRDIDDVIFFQQYKNGNIKNCFKKPQRLVFNKVKLFFLYPYFIIKILFSRMNTGISFGPFHEAGTFSNLLFSLAGFSETIGCFGYYSKLLTTKVSDDLLKKHWIDIYIGIINSVVGETDVKEIDLRISYEISKEEQQLIQINLDKKGLFKPYLISVIHPGGGTYVNSKLWGYEKFAAIADYLYQKYNMSIFITGSKEELQLANLVSEKMLNPSFVVAGEYTFPMVASLLAKTELLITNDTSLLHLADAMDTKRVISIWGPTDSTKIGPRNNHNHFIQSGLDCAPCITLDAGDETKRCNRIVKEECLKIIDTNKVIDRIDNALITIGQ
jgi:ADP-heptose:LPS heptosyltransferase